MAVVTAVAPPKGLPLPFVSAGGTSLLVLTASTGLLLGLARWPEEDPETGADWLASLPQRKAGPLASPAATRIVP
ncbi:MAG: hypothetical protein ACI9EF_003693 [Pseudohongiellaceae bacterium]